MRIAFELNGKPQVSVFQGVMIYGEYVVFNVGRTFLSEKSLLHWKEDREYSVNRGNFEIAS